MKKDHPMQLAINSALEGVLNNEGGPFGACILKDNQVIAVSHNTVIKDEDPTCHAEMNAIREAAKNLGTYDLSGCELYSTVEPCPMCLGAIYWSRIDTIFVGADKSIAAKYGFDDAVFYEELSKAPVARSIRCEVGLLADESEAVFMTWQGLARSVY